MSEEIRKQLLRMIEEAANSRPSAMEFEMAYQARIAIDRIRFAITVTEHSCNRSEQTREANFQLLDALDRLEAAERSFQRKFKRNSGLGAAETANHRESAAGIAAD
jgi:hypothetical protein